MAGVGSERRLGKRRGRARRLSVKSISKLVAASIAIVFIIALGSVWMSSRPIYTPTATSPLPTQTPTQPHTEPTRPVSNVGIIDQFYSENQSFTDEAIELMKSRGMSVSVHKDKEVTVELYRKLPTFGYNLIVLRVHAGISVRPKERLTFLFTAEPYSTSDYVYEQLSDQITPGVINPDVGEPPVFTVGPMFVRMSMEGNFNGATIILSSCLGLYNQYLAEALIEKGASVFISWNEIVSLDHTDKAALTLLKALIVEKRSVKEAVAKTMWEVGPDPTYGGILLYYPPDRGGSTLVLELRFEPSEHRWVQCSGCMEIIGVSRVLKRSSDMPVLC